MKIFLLKITTFDFYIPLTPILKASNPFECEMLHANNRHIVSIIGI